mmetsp:Transcript_49256/g.114143  ORF Transcript_49256/g.114143 Transcript_49256/m.114143 type:complete len:219 (+) Transcript_49256:79-735(+)
MQPCLLPGQTQLTQPPDSPSARSPATLHQPWTEPARPEAHIHQLQAGTGVATGRQLHVENAFPEPSMQRIDLLRPSHCATLRSSRLPWKRLRRAAPAPAPHSGGPNAAAPRTVPSGPMLQTSSAAKRASASHAACAKRHERCKRESSTAWHLCSYPVESSRACVKNSGKPPSRSTAQPSNVSAGPSLDGSGNGRSASTGKPWRYIGRKCSPTFSQPSP